jgi:hypothetical protein
MAKGCRSLSQPRVDRRLVEVGSATEPRAQMARTAIGPAPLAGGDEICRERRTFAARGDEPIEIDRVRAAAVDAAAPPRVVDAKDGQGRWNRKRWTSTNVRRLGVHKQSPPR